MALSEHFVQSHIDYWETRLARGNRPYRQHWPSRLFRHEPIENVVGILQSGRLLSRNDSAGRIVHDIAPAQIIQHRDVAHNFARLYFRPRNPTQYRIEGIRKPQDLYQGTQAAVLVLLVFRALQILVEDNVQFSDGNMQSYYTVTGSTEDAFNDIPFHEVYHEGVFDPHSEAGQSILRRRCAEVLLPSPLALEGNLQAVMCRSSAERTTLLHLLGDAADQWRDRIRVYSEPGLFQNEFAYLDTVDGSPDGVRFAFHPRRDGQGVRTEFWITGENQEIHVGPRDFDTSKRWIFREQFEAGIYEVRFHVEDCLAHHSVFLIDELPF